jgi:hypothetical protein
MLKRTKDIFMEEEQIPHNVTEQFIRQNLEHYQWHEYNQQHTLTQPSLKKSGLIG